MSACKSLDRTLYKEISFGSSLALEVECGKSGTSTGTTDEYLPLVLTIEIDEHVASHESRFHTRSTGQLSLLVSCEYTLYRSVLNLIAVEDSQFDGATDTVVGTKSRALGSKPFTVNIRLNGILVEVKLYIHEFVAHHVHVALQDNRLTVFHTLGGWFTDNHVTRFIHLCVKIMTLSPLTEIINHFLLALGRAGDFVYSRKLLEYTLWL